jgi:hypothetical protein
VAEAFPHGAVFVRTFDLGGDKFPMFLHMPREENPFLGWRAIRVLLDEPELFRTQLRALLRATAHGDVRMMLPLVNDVEEVQNVRELLEEEESRLSEEGIAYNPGYKLGVMIETPAAALDAAELARSSDFFSIGTNDLVQYTLAVDRTNTRLAKLYNPFHPAVVRQLHQVARVGRAAGIEVSVCGEMAANPLGAFLLIGLDITVLSMAWPSLPEIKKLDPRRPHRGRPEGRPKGPRRGHEPRRHAVPSSRGSAIRSTSRLFPAVELVGPGVIRIAFAPQSPSDLGPSRRTSSPKARNSLAHDAFHVRVRHRRPSGQDRGPDLRRGPRPPAGARIRARASLARRS